MIEFNPKGGSILDQELSASGLEMSAEPISTTFMAINAVTGLLSTGAGIFQGFQSSNAAKQSLNFQQQQYANDIKTQTAQTELSNEYNKNVFATERANYLAQRDYDYKTAVMGVRSQNKLFKIEHAQRMKEYNKNVLISGAQFDLNAIAESQAIDNELGYLKDQALDHLFKKETNKSALERAMFEGMLATKEQGVQMRRIKDREAYGQISIQNTIDQLMDEGALQKEVAIVEGLVAQGRSQLGQAGKSLAATNHSNMIALQRGLRAIDTQLTGKYKQAATELSQLAAETEVAEAGIGLNLSRIQQSVKEAQEDYNYNDRVLDASLASSLSQAERNIKQIALDRRIADINVLANMMLKPKKMPKLPIPEMPPLREEVEPMKLLAPNEFKYESPGDSLEKALEKRNLPSGHPDRIVKDSSDKPYLDKNGKVKKGFQKQYRKGQIYYVNLKTGQTYTA